MWQVRINNVLIILLFSVNSFAQPTTTEDTVFDENIKTIIISPANNNQTSSVLPSARYIGDQIPLVLSFDEINVEDANYFYVKIYHCDAQWQLSNLSEMQ